MKIGIMTFWWSEDNYGQLLQCYALQKYLRDQGHEPFLIRYRYDKDIIPTDYRKKLLNVFNPIRLYNFIKKKLLLTYRRKKIQNEQGLYPRHFKSFRDKYIKQYHIEYKSWNDLKRNPPSADMYIVGSDQVWNFGNKDVKNYKNVIHAYFLDFGNESTKRISYAASWGVDSLPLKIVNEIKPLLQKFDFVSVREAKGIELCAQSGYKNAVWVPDPTMLLGSEIYRTIYKDNTIRKPKKKYVLLYMLVNKHDFNIDHIYKFAEKKELDVIYVTGNGILNAKKKFFASIPEWLYLVDNAEYVVTNSFHCSVFSIIFKKQFGVVPLKGSFKSMNDRINSLFSKCGIENRFLLNSNLSMLDVLYTPEELYDCFFEEFL